MIYILAVNPAIDYNVYCDGFSLGKINRGSKSEVFGGGKGINVATLLTRLGVPNKLFGFAAGFTGLELLRHIDKENIDRDFIMLNEGYTRINVKIRSDAETDINMNGFVPNKESLNELYKKLEVLKENDILCLCGNVQKELGDNFYEKVGELAVKKGARIAVDTTGKQLLNTLKFSPILIKPNLEELCEILNRDIKTFDEIVSAAKELCKMGAENVLVTLGSDGAVLVTNENEVLKAEAIKGKVKSSVGAGDSAFAAFLSKYKTVSLREALDFSMLCGAATAFSSGICNVADIEKLKS